MTEAADILLAADSVLVVDWPSRDVPDTLARAGFAVVVHGGPGPEDYTEHRLENGGIVAVQIGRPPEHADVVYTHRPVDELPEIVETASAIGARAIWVQSGLAGDGQKDPSGCWMPPEDSRRARPIVESAGMTYIDEPYIADVVRQLGLR